MGVDAISRCQVRAPDSTTNMRVFQQELLNKVILHKEQGIEQW